MDLYILDSNFQTIGVVDNYESLIWAKRYFEFGDCEIYLPASQRNRALFAIGNYITRTDDDMVCRIVSHEIATDEDNGDYITVVGEDLRAVLNQRIVYRQTNFRGTAEDFIRRIVYENLISTRDEVGHRKIDNFFLGDSNGFTDRLNMQSTYDYVGDKVIEVCRRFGYGSRLVLDGEFLVFNIYRGVDRSYNQEQNPYVVFSSEFDNLARTKFIQDVTPYKSMAVIAGAGEGSKRIFTTIDDGQTGIDRYELYVDANDISNEVSYDELVEAFPGGTIVDNGNEIVYVVDDEYIAVVDSRTEPTNAVLYESIYADMLAERGHEVKAEHVVTTAFEGEAEPNTSYLYGQDYNLGDIVQVINDYGVSVGARITEVIESDDASGYSIIPTFEYQEV